MFKILEDAFTKTADRAIAAKQSAYLKGHFSFFGIPKPTREILEKPILKTITGDLEDILLNLWAKEQREFQYCAINYAKLRKKTWTPSHLGTFEKMIRNKSWWDSVDDIASNLVGGLLYTHQQLIPIMDAWIEDPDMWIRRTAIIFQLKWKQNTDEKRLFSFCRKTMHEKEFFIRKAIGWALREYSKTNPDTVHTFIDKHRNELSGLSIREGSKYLAPNVAL